MDVDGVEAGAIERRRHLDLAVDALLAQDRDARARAAAGAQRRGDVVVRIEGQVRRQAGIVGADAAGLLLVGAGRIVAQRLHRVRGLRPEAAQEGATLLEDRLARLAERSDDRRRAGRPGGGRSAPRAVARRATAARARRRAPRTATTAPSSSANSAAIGSAPSARQIDVEPDAARERHLEQRHEEAAVAAIVIGGSEAGGVQLLHGREEAGQQRRIVEIGRRRRRARRRPARGAEPPRRFLPRPRSTSSSSVGPASARSSGVSARRTSVTGANAVTISDSGAVTLRALSPASQTVRMDIESLPTGMAMPSAGQSSTPDGADGVVEARVLAGVAGGGHPVRRQLDVAEARDRRRGDVGDRLGRPPGAPRRPRRAARPARARPSPSPRPS